MDKKTLAELKTDLDVRLDHLIHSPIVAEMRGKAVVIPLAAMSLSLASLYFSRRLLSRPNSTFKRPLLFQVSIAPV